MNTLFYLIFLALQFYAHPVHLSVTNIEYNKSEKRIDISIRLFKDDFETILANNNDQEINLNKKNENKNTNLFITKYITDNLKFKINGNHIKERKFIFKERRMEDITMWLTFEIKFKNVINTIEITNTLMTDLYRDQKNMLIFTYNNKQSAIEFTRKKTTNTLTF